MPLTHQNLEQKIIDVECAYQAQAGGASFCQLQKDGRVTGGAKYEEGRLVALHTARRLLRECPDEPTDTCMTAIAAEQKTWLDALVTLQAKAQSSIPWVAYRQGGADALAWVLKHLQAS